MKGAVEQLPKAGDPSLHPLQMVVDVAEVLMERSRDRFEAAAGDLVDGLGKRSDGSVEVEDLALELVDPLDRIGRVGREDLSLDLLDVGVDALGGTFVAVDDVVDDRVEHHPGAVLQEVGPLLDASPDLAQLPLAVAHRDDEGRVDEEQQLAELDHLVGVNVVGRLDHDEHGVAVALDLRALVSFDCVLDRQLVQSELARYRLELRWSGLDHPKPDEGIGIASGFTGALERKLAVAAAPILIHSTIDDHPRSIVAGRSQSVDFLARQPNSPWARDDRSRLLSNRTFVIGVGMTKFEKPGTKEGDYPDWAKEAGEKALADAGISYDDVEQAYAGYCYGDSTYGQRALYQLGLTGIPVVNVNNNCSTGSSALFLARQAVKGGLVDCALALGFEKMEPGSLGVKYTDRTNALDKHAMRMFEIRDPEQSPPAPQMFGNAGRDHMEKYGSNPDHYAWIGWKNHKHSVNNPYAQFQDEYSIEDIKAAKMIHDPLTKLQCSPTSDGSACAIVASERYVDEHGLWDQAVEIAGQSMVTDLSSTFAEDTDCMKIVGSDMSKQAADEAYEEAGIAAEQVDVCELHDCFSANELITYEALGFAAQGEGHKLVEEEATTYGGKVVVNPSGGLISKGHPLGATGLAQCSELTWQLRGQSDKRQVEGAKVALQHNIGLGGAAVVTVYKPAA